MIAQLRPGHTQVLLLSQHTSHNALSNEGSGSSGGTNRRLWSSVLGDPNKQRTLGSQVPAILFTLKEGWRGSVSDFNPLNLKHHMDLICNRSSS